MSNSFKSPLTPQISDPKNIDRPIQELQSALATLSWLDKSFGRSWESFRNNSKGQKITYPQVWQGPDLDLLDCLPNDNLKSQSFFWVNDPVTNTAFVPFQYNRYSAPVSLIVWFNYKRIDPSVDYPFLEVLKSDVQGKITNAILSAYTEVKILSVTEKVANVFRGFSINDVGQQELIYPYGGFRIELSLSWQEDCRN